MSSDTGESYQDTKLAFQTRANLCRHWRNTVDCSLIDLLSMTPRLFPIFVPNAHICFIIERQYGLQKVNQTTIDNLSWSKVVTNATLW